LKLAYDESKKQLQEALNKQKGIEEKEKRNK